MAYNFETKEELIEFLNSDEGEGQEIANTVKKGLIDKRDDLLSEVKTLKTKLNEVGDVDELRTKATKAQELEAKLEKLESQSNNGDERIEELKRSLEEQLQAEREKYTNFVNKYKETKLDSVVSDAISKHRGIPELLKPIVRSRLKENVTEDGDVRIEVLSKEGKPMFVGGEEANIDHIMDELKSDEIYARAFEGTGSSGTGSRGSKAKANGVILDPDDPNYSLTEAMKYHKNNPSA